MAHGVRSCPTSPGRTMKLDLKTYYQILDVPPEADDAQIVVPTGMSDGPGVLKLR